MDRLVQERHTGPQKSCADGMERIRLNIGGQKHETYFSTVKNLPDTRLFSIIESAVKSPDYDPETTEVFFDRHPAVFAQILNYYRTGKLHCPTDVCGPLFEQELIYWGIDEKDMEPCCWANYTQHRDAEENLKNVLYEGTSEECVADTSFMTQQSEIARLWKKIQPKVWATLDESRSSNRARVFSFVSVLFIIVSVAMFCVNTIPELSTNERWKYFFTILEQVCGVWFTLEFVLRIVFCPDKRAFAKSWSTWIDFLAITPFYLKLFVSNTHKNAINALLVIRLLRLFRFFRLIYGLQVLSHTLKASSYELVLLLSMLLIPVILFSSIVFFIEDHFDRPNTKFRSIPHSFWWSLITITTVGYGDMHPVSWLGKIVGSMCAICGVLIVALPVSIIGSNFSLFYTHAQARLKLPKKKQRLFIQQTSTVYTERQMPRRRTIRRKASSRASDTCSFMMCGDSRPSSIQGFNLSNGTKRSSVITKDEGKSYAPMRRVPKKISTISIKIPALESPGESNSYEGSELPSPRGYSSFDSTHYVTKRRSLTTPPDGVRLTNNNTEGESGESLRSMNNTHKRNARSNGTQSTPEIIPLLIEPDAPKVMLKDSEQKEICDSPCADTPDQLSDLHHLSVERDEYLTVQMGIESENEQDESDNDACMLTDGCVSIKRVPRRRKDGIVNWKRRPSSLESISERSINNIDRQTNSVNDSGVEVVDENISGPDTAMPVVHFNRGRRQPVF